MPASGPALPPAAGTPYRIAVVCLGNICRSPMAAVVLGDLANRAGLSGRIEVTSSGTGDWHRGTPMDDRAAASLLAGGYDPTGHRARVFAADWFDRDLILAMDARNRADIDRLAAGPNDRSKVRMFRDFDPLATSQDLDVPDPYYGGTGGFADVLTMVERTTRALIAALESRLG